jgi:hypothetical protein
MSFTDLKVLFIFMCHFSVLLGEINSRTMNLIYFPQTQNSASFTRRSSIWIGLNGILMTKIGKLAQLWGTGLIGGLGTVMVVCTVVGGTVVTMRATLTLAEDQECKFMSYAHLFQGLSLNFKLHKYIIPSVARTGRRPVREARL